MKKLLLLPLLMLLGCAAGMVGVCRQEAVYAVAVAGEKVPTRVALGYINGGYHAQALGLLNDKWQYLCMSGNGTGVSPCAVPDFSVTETMDGSLWLHAYGMRIYDLTERRQYEK